MPKIINETPQLVPVGLLRRHPRNARQGDVGAVYESIEHNGFFGYVVVQKSTNYIIAGNHRYLAALQHNMREIPAVFVDVDDEAALRILLADNRTSDLASYDNNRLAEILAELENSTEGKLAGTGYDADDLEQLIEEIARKNDTSGDAEEKKKKGEDVLAIVLICENEAEQSNLEDKLKSMGFYPRKTTLNERTQLTVG